MSFARPESNWNSDSAKTSIAIESIAGLRHSAASLRRALATRIASARKAALRQGYETTEMRKSKRPVAQSAHCSVSSRLPQMAAWADQEPWCIRS